MTNKQALDALEAIFLTICPTTTWPEGTECQQGRITLDQYNTIRAALTSPPVNTALVEALIELDQACISDFSFKYPGGTHEVVQKAITAAEAQPAQKVVVGLEEAFKLEDERHPEYFMQAVKAFKEKYGCMPIVKFKEAARLQLARQKMGGI